MSINKKIWYKDYVYGDETRFVDFLICPTDAVDMIQMEISDVKCVECLLCKYSPISDNTSNSKNMQFKKFYEYVRKDNEYLTKWIGQIFTIYGKNTKCGFDIKIKFGSREKRIQLLVIIDTKPIIIKIVKSFKDIERGVLKLEEIVKVLEQDNMPTPKIIITVNDLKTNYTKRLQNVINKFMENHDFQLIYVETFWNVVKNNSNEFIDWNKILNDGN